MNLYRMLLMSLVFLVSLALTAQDQSSDGIRRKNFAVDSSGLALQGYDPISYWTGNPTKGFSKYSFQYKGVTYHFVNIENQTQFSKSPEKYEPEFGGWCAYAIGKNAEKVEINPKRFKISENKLYLFYDGFFGDTLKPWNEDEKSLKDKAYQNWSKIAIK